MTLSVAGAVRLEQLRQAGLGQLKEGVLEATEVDTGVGHLAVGVGQGQAALVELIIDSNTCSGYDKSTASAERKQPCTGKPVGP